MSSKRMNERNTKIINLSPVYMPMISLMASIISMWIEYGPLSWDNIDWIVYLGRFSVIIGLLVGAMMIWLQRMFPKFQDYLAVTCIVFTMLLSLVNIMITRGAYLI